MRRLVVAILACAWMAVPMALWAADKEKPKDHAPAGKKIVGEIKEVTSTALTLSVRGKEGAAATTQTFALDNKTKVQVEQHADVAGKHEHKFVDGTTADLKVGKRVAVVATANGKTAEKVMVLVVHESKPGEGKKPAPPAKH